MGIIYVVLCLSGLSAIIGFLLYGSGSVRGFGFTIGRRWEKKVPLTVLVNEIILFAIPLMKGENVKTRPAFRISYHSHKRYMASYKERNITIYKKNVATVPDLVNITLHEIAHHIQCKNDPKRYAQYAEFSIRHGYLNNPLECEAREFARKWTPHCLKHLLVHGFIEQNGL